MTILMLSGTFIELTACEALKLLLAALAKKIPLRPPGSQEGLRTASWSSVTAAEKGSRALGELGRRSDAREHNLEYLKKHATLLIGLCMRVICF